MSSTRNTLQDQRVVIIGGTSGIGFAVARAAHDAGAAVVVISSRERKVADAVAALGTRAEGHAADLTDEAALPALFERIGPFDHLVYSAGDALQIGPLPDIDRDTIRKAFDVRVFGAMTAVKHAVPYLRTGGSVVLTSGVASLRPQKGWSLAASFCAAMEGFTRALAVELAPLRVNLVSPGLVRTPLWDGMPEADRAALYASAGAALPVGRVGEADDIAGAYLYLMTNRYSTGQTIVVDGGGVLV
nr:3-alpha-hydroxycholanate dehydrogenase (NADP(+)) [Paraburkholderia busanensis]